MALSIQQYLNAQEINRCVTYDHPMYAVRCYNCNCIAAHFMENALYYEAPANFDASLGRNLLEFCDWGTTDGGYPICRICRELGYE